MDSFKAVTRYMQDSPTFYQDIWFIVIAVGTIGAVWAAITLWDRLQSIHAPAKPRYKTLFVELCQAHKLADADAQWLQNAAMQFGIDDPARIFFTPQAVEVHLQSDEANALIARALLQKLFGVDAASES